MEFIATSYIIRLEHGRIVCSYSDYVLPSCVIIVTYMWLCYVIDVIDVYVSIFKWECAYVCTLNCTCVVIFAN